ncbi:conserved hypothetical protein [Paraburkholderia ribeironis]|uniref:Oxidoreductase-like domain-containing protein n=1 Tax=Paraburkholderia ribeironis TaxID=1247936 RepID=A0A1N7RIQ1_9BURK|nr:oxidoreductase-like domain-containing protein [Paraburkholderia ribeironis]SIT34993.1 conserved hypothetical protein [Paraburkholderia ribeironis]
MPRATPSDDPQPQPPVRPSLDDCCHSGCIPCVFDLYDEALERYQIALAEWQARHAAPPRAGKPRKPRKARTPRMRR